MEKKISFLIYSETKKNLNWNDYIIDCNKISKFYGYDINYLAVESANIRSDKLLTYERNLRRLSKEIEKNEKIKSLEFYSLSAKYGFYSTYYDFHILINDQLMLLTINEEDFNKIDINFIISFIKKYKNNSTLEIFKLDRTEWPISYALKVNENYFYKSLEIVDRINLY